jgi:hypothetical protein
MSEGSLSSRRRRRGGEEEEEEVVPLGCGCCSVGHYSGSSVPNNTSVLVISFFVYIVGS